MIFTSCDEVVSVKVMLPIVLAVLTATFWVAVYSLVKNAVKPLASATMLLVQFPVPPQIPEPAAPVHVPLAAFDVFTDNASANAVARMLGIKRRRDARTWLQPT